MPVVHVRARDTMPRHVAIIMDGNGRWALARGLPRIQGHRRGVAALRTAVETAARCGVDYLTIYSFSAENWSRPPNEIRDLMTLIRHFVHEDLDRLSQANIRIEIIGERQGLEPGILKLLERAETTTATNTGMTLVVAFNYGARQEIVGAARRLALAVQAGTLNPDEITVETLARNLDTRGIPDPDLIIRTSGEQRLSNFLLWQAAYAEFVFLEICWPDFDEAAFHGALETYRARDRRFGGLAKALGT